MRTMTRRQLLLIAFMAAVFALIGAIVGLVVTSAGDGSSTSLRNLTLQPSDLPPEFVLAEEKFYSREELLAELPAESQIAEAGLQEAVHLTYESREDVPMVIDVFLYGYDNEAAADTAHAYAVESDWMHLLLRRVTQSTDTRGARLSGGLAEDIGEDGASMAGEVNLDDDSTMSVSAYMMRSGSARAEVVTAGESIFVTPDMVARNQYLRLERPDAVAAP